MVLTRRDKLTSNEHIERFVTTTTEDLHAKTNNVDVFGFCSR